MNSNLLFQFYAFLILISLYFRYLQMYQFGWSGSNWCWHVGLSSLHWNGDADVFRWSKWYVWKCTVEWGNFLFHVKKTMIVFLFTKTYINGNSFPPWNRPNMLPIVKRNGKSILNLRWLILCMVQKLYLVLVI